MKNKKLLAGGIFGLFAVMLTIFAVSSYASADEETKRGRGRGAENSAMHEQMETFRDSITRTVENIDNGAVITMTSDNAEAVTFLQSQESRVPKNASVTETRENITNGVKITVTSDDADEVARIQENTANPKGDGMRLGGSGQKGGKGAFGQMNSETREQMQAFHDSITRTVENIDNGAVVTMTSDNAEAVTFLQTERPDRSKRNNDSVTETVENITNGVKITVTSDDADEVARIQENTANPKGDGMRLGEGREGKRGGGCGGGRGMRQGGDFEDQE